MFFSRFPVAFALYQYIVFYSLVFVFQAIMAALFRLCLILVLLGAVQVLGARRGQSHRHMSRLHSYFKRQYGELFAINQVKAKMCIRLRV